MRIPQNPGRYTAFIFDYDGTLVDTEELLWESLETALRLHDVPYDQAWLRAEPLSSLTRLEERLGLTPTAAPRYRADSLIAAGTSHYERHASRLRAVDKAPTVVRTLARIAPLAVATANVGHLVRAGLRAIGLEDCFTTIVAREDVVRVKPAPDAFLEAARRLDVPPSTCLVYENSDPGVEAALAAGMTVIDVREPDGELS